MTVSSAAGTTVNLASTTGISAGWTLNQGNLYSVVEEVLSGTALRVRDSGLAWTAAAGTAGEPIRSLIVFHPHHHGSPAKLKHWGDLAIILAFAQFDYLELTVSNELVQTSPTSPTLRVISLQPKKSNYVSAMRTLMPKGYERSRFSYLRLGHSHAFRPLELLCVAMDADIVSEKAK